MTAEIAVMNKLAVALATDSAVTIRQGDSPTRIYNSANKLFTLSKYNPVGVMVYGAVEFMKVPWETVIKVYRENLGNRSFATLEEHADDLIRFLDRPNIFVPVGVQEETIGAVARGLFVMIARRATEKDAQNHLDKHGEIVNDLAFADIVQKCIHKQLKELQGIKRLPHLPRRYCQTLLRKYHKVIEKETKEIFGSVNLGRGPLRDLERIVGEFCSRDSFPRHSGIVVAGFGRDDIFPALV